MFSETRSAYSAISTSLANMICKQSNTQAIVDHLAGIEEEWADFVEKGLANINEVNNSALAGHTRKYTDDAADGFDGYEMQMEKLFE
jgi:hypothetical protein